MNIQPAVSNVVFEEGIANFSISLYSALERTGNEFISPYSITSALLLLILGTGTTTKYEMETAIFEYEEPNDVHQGYKLLNDQLAMRTTPGVTFSIANKLYARQGLNLLTTFSTKALTIYGSEVERLDFAQNTENSRLSINKWISANTNNKIKNMIPKNVLNRDTLLVLANAIYFKGTWKTEFKKNITKQRNFFIGPNEQTLVHMMYGEFDAKSGEDLDLDCKILQLPYKGNQMSMIFLLPNDGAGLNELEDILAMEDLTILLSELQTQRTIIRIPKFTMQREYDLKPIMSILGVTEIFDPTIADFSEMTPSHAHVSDMRHKAYIEVNEEGSEAAAATTAVIQTRSNTIPKPTPFQFVADHPFLFIIQDDETGTPLFIGRYTRP